MMLMRMKPDKSQISPNYFYENAGSFSFVDRDKALMHGYVSFEALIVGAAGGFGGNATGSGGAAGSVAYGGGPGGGGMAHIAGLIRNLAAAVPVVVGAPGTDGASTSNNTKAGDGTDGGASSFSGYDAGGGKRGGGDDWTVSGSSPNYTIYNAGYQSGEGGVSSAIMATLVSQYGYSPNFAGTPGQSGSFYTTPGAGSPDTTVSTSPTAGKVVKPNLPVGNFLIKALGKGGAGGPGDNTNVTGDVARAGAAGSTDAAVSTDYDAPGAASVSSKGGAGGGVDVSLFKATSPATVRGTRNSASGSAPQGWVGVKLI